MMKKLSLQLDTLNTPPVLPDVLKSVQENGLVIEEFRARVLPHNDKFGSISIAVQADPERMAIAKFLLERVQGVVRVSVREEEINYYKSYGSV